MEGNTTREEEIEVKSLIEHNNWRVAKLNSLISEEVANYIYSDIPLETNKDNDKVWWMGSSNGSFLVNSTYQIIRKRRTKVESHDLIWSKYLPHKISFFL